MVRSRFSTLMALMLATALGAAADAPPEVAVGKPLPTFAGYSLDGKMVSLQSLLAPKGEPKATALVLSFFATWCVNCKDGLPIIQRVGQSLRASGVRTLFIDCGEDDEKVAPFVAGLKVTGTTLADAHFKVCARLGVDKALPRTYVVDGNGVLRTVIGKEEKTFEADLLRAIKEAQTP